MTRTGEKLPDHLDVNAEVKVLPGRVGGVDGGFAPSARVLPFRHEGLAVGIIGIGKVFLLLEPWPDHKQGEKRG
jgi:hypothetical protein